MLLCVTQCYSVLCVNIFSGGRVTNMYLCSLTPKPLPPYSLCSLTVSKQEGGRIASFSAPGNKARGRLVPWVANVYVM